MYCRKAAWRRRNGPLAGRGGWVSMRVMSTRLRNTLLLLALAAPALAEDAPWQLLMPGQYHGDEAPIQPGKGWLSLSQESGGWALATAAIRAQRVFDPVLDAEGQATGVEIAAEGGEVIAFIRYPGLRPGAVETASWDSESGALGFGPEPLAIDFAGERYSIFTRGGAAWLAHGSRETALQELAVAAEGDELSEASASLIWAGDLDRDGALDLLVSSAGYNSYGACLYLSSRGEGGAQLGLLACHRGVGC